MRFNLPAGGWCHPSPISALVGYIGGYASFVGYDKRRGNAIGVPQNGCNRSNNSGIGLLVDRATQDKVV